MKIRSITALSLTTAALLSACSPSAEQAPSATAPEAQGASVPAPAVPPQSRPASTAKVIGLEGLNDLRLGQPVPKSSSWAERGAQASDNCRTVTSPDYPGIYAMVVGGAVRRITVGQRSDVKLVEGVGVGASEADVLKWFAGFRSEPHKYVAAPAKYLTAPNAAGGDPAVRFEIGEDGKVSLIHVGMMPELAYVEGCS